MGTKATITLDGNAAGAKKAGRETVKSLKGVTVQAKGTQSALAKMATGGLNLVGSAGTKAFRELYKWGTRGLAATVAGVAATTLQLGKMEQGLINVWTMMGNEPKSFLKESLDALYSINAELPVGLSKLVDSFFTLTSNSYKGVEGLSVLQSAAEGAYGSSANLAIVMNGTSKAMKAFGYDASEAGKVVDIISKGAEIASTDLNSLVAGLGLMGDKAATAGVSLEEMLGLFAELTATLEPQHATTRIAALFTELGTPTEAKAKIFKSMGIDLKREGLIATLEKIKKLSETIGKSDPSVFLRELVGSVEATGALNPALARLEGVRDKVGQMFGEDVTGLRRRNVEKQNEGLLNQYGKLFARVAEVAKDALYPFYEWQKERVTGLNKIMTAWYTGEGKDAVVGFGEAFAESLGKLPEIFETIQGFAQRAKGFLDDIKPALDLLWKVNKALTAPMTALAGVSVMGAKAIQSPSSAWGKAKDIAFNWKPALPSSPLGKGARAVGAASGLAGTQAYASERTRQIGGPAVAQTEARQAQASRQTQPTINNYGTVNFYGENRERRMATFAASFSPLFPGGPRPELAFEGAR